MSDEDAFARTELDGEARADGYPFVELSEVFLFREAGQAGEATNFKVEVAGRDDFDERAAFADQFGKNGRFGASKRFLDWQEDGIWAECERATEGCADGDAGRYRFSRAGSDCRMFFGRATNNYGPFGQFRVLAACQRYEEVWYDKAGNFHGIWKYRTNVLVCGETWRYHLGVSAPLAYFLTFITYGSRLAGDERGSVDRNHNRFETPRITPNGSYEGYARLLQTSSAFVLGSAQRVAVDRAMRERCAYAGWELHALNVRTNHVHVVLTAETKPELAMNSLKAWATRSLRRENLIGTDQKVWARHGSTRYVWDERGLEAVCRYTLEMQ